MLLSDLDGRDGGLYIEAGARVGLNPHDFALGPESVRGQANDGGYYALSLGSQVFNLVHGSEEVKEFGMVNGLNNYVSAEKGELKGGLIASAGIKLTWWGGNPNEFAGYSTTKTWSFLIFSVEKITSSDGSAHGYAFSIGSGYEVGTSNGKAGTGFFGKYGDKIEDFNNRP